jgi:membrane-associated HD superfamily phosphohydrolase
MKYAHRINPKDANQIPPFFSEEWLAEAVKKLDTSKMSPDQLAMYHITMVRARTILDYEEKKRNEDRQKMRQEVKEEVKQEVKEEVKQEVKEEVKQEVLMEQQAQTIIKLYKKGVSIDFIADVIGLSSNQIETIINTLNL